MNNVTFLPPASQISAQLWEKLYKLKLNVSKLSDANIPCKLRYHPVTDTTNAPYLLDRDSILYPGEDGNYTVVDGFKLCGVLKKYNTMQEFKYCAKSFKNHMSHCGNQKIIMWILMV